MNSPGRPGCVVQVSELFADWVWSKGRSKIFHFERSCINGGVVTVRHPLVLKRPFLWFQQAKLIEIEIGNSPGRLVCMVQVSGRFPDWVLSNGRSKIADFHRSSKNGGVVTVRHPLVFKRPFLRFQQAKFFEIWTENSPGRPVCVVQVSE